MEFNSDQIAAVVGSQQLEIIGLRMQLAQALARIKELEPKPTHNEHPSRGPDALLSAIEGGKT